MKVVLLTHFYPRQNRDYYLSRSRVGLAAAADAHQYAIALGLKEMSPNMTVVNLPALFYFPFRYRDFFHKGERIKENGLDIINLSYCLLMEYTFISQYLSAKKELRRIVRQTDDIVYIVVYGIKPQLMHAAVDIKNEFSGKVKLCDIVPDLPEDVNTHNRFISTLLSSIRNAFNKSAYHYFKEFDSFVLLTKYMADKVTCNKKDYIVSEGIYEEFITKRIPHEEDKENFIIFYGGMLYEKFGIMNLVNAVKELPLKNVRLQLCGYGDCVDNILELAKNDERFQYLGVLSRDEVLKLQSKASLLVNPRIPDNNPFTKYSFPSKTMEYFGSGTPTLLYQLDGIPNEYYDYCYNIALPHTDTHYLSAKLMEIARTPLEERLEMANAARKFVLDKKNYRIVGASIYNLLEKTV